MPYPTVLGQSELYTVCAERAGGHTVLLQNLSIDPLFDFDILLPRAARDFRLFGAEGEAKGARIHVKGELSPMASLLLTVEYEEAPTV